MRKTWCHENGNIFRVTGHLCGEFTGDGRPVTWSFDEFFELHLNKRLSKQLWGWSFEIPSHPLWCHCNVFQFSDVIIAHWILQDDRKLQEGREDEGMGTADIKYGDSLVYLQHSKTGLWLSYQTFETKKRGVGRVEEKKVTHHSSPMLWHLCEANCSLTHRPLGNLNEIFRCNFQAILVIDGWGISCEITLRWMSLNLTDDKSTLVQVMAWCRQATSHYLSQCWPRSLSPYDVIRPQWVKISHCVESVLWQYLALI